MTLHTCNVGIPAEGNRYLDHFLSCPGQKGTAPFNFMAEFPTGKVQIEDPKGKVKLNIAVSMFHLLKLEVSHCSSHFVF